MRIFAITSVPVAENGNVTRKYSETYTDGATEEELNLLDLVMSALCPVTYRGYNYDFTTGLYYLQSRYYNPEWGRFLNTDDTAIMLTKIDEVDKAFKKWDQSDLNSEELKYYLDVNNRVLKMMVDYTLTLIKQIQMLHSLKLHMHLKMVK